MRYRGAMFPELDGDFLVGGLAIRQLNRVDMDGDSVIKSQALLTEPDRRIRDVDVDDEGAIWVLTEHPRGEDGLTGELWRLTPSE